MSLFLNFNQGGQQLFPTMGSSLPPGQITTLALGEEGGTAVTTQALGEEGGGVQPQPPITTLALGEEGGGTVTTLALGEEGGGIQPPVFPPPGQIPGNGRPGEQFRQTLNQMLTLLQNLLQQLQPPPPPPPPPPVQPGAGQLDPQLTQLMLQMLQLMLQSLSANQGGASPKPY